MRVDLPSGAWVETRDKLMSQDKFDVQDAITFTVSDGKQQEVSAGIQNRMRNALLARIITAWSYTDDGIPIPANNPGGEAILGVVLDIDDYNALADAVEPLMKKVSFAGGDKVPN